MVLNSTTVLLVEDSRLCAERFRLMARACAVRLRWAESLREAQWHLRTYRPDALIVDIGLSDGSGLSLIRSLRRGFGPDLTIMAMSGEPDYRLDALQAGADSFLAKDTLSLSQFRRIFGGRTPQSDVFSRPLLNAAALHSDLDRAARALAEGEVNYGASFLHGVARDAQDSLLSGASEALVSALTAGQDTAPHLQHLAQLLAHRLSEAHLLDH